MQYSSGTLNTLKKETVISAKKYCSERREIQVQVLLCFPFFWPCRAACICIVRVCAQSLQLCPTLCNPIDYSPPGSSVHGILQARILEWVTMPSSRGSSQPRDRTLGSCIGRQILDPLSHQGSPCICIYTCTQPHVYEHTHTCIWFYSCMIYYVVCIPRFCSLSTMNICSKIIFAVRNYPVPFKMLSSILGLHPQDASSNFPPPPPPNHNKPKMSPDIANCPLGDKTAPTGELTMYTHTHTHTHIHMACALTE